MSKQLYFRVSVVGEKLTTSLKYRHFIQVRNRFPYPNDFALDMLRYDRCYIPDYTDATLIRTFYERPMDHSFPDGGICVARYWDTSRVTDHTWCAPRWQSLHWPIKEYSSRLVQKLPRPLRYRHYALVRAITEPDPYGRTQWHSSFPWELMQQEESCPVTELVSHRIERLLTEHSTTPTPIVLLKYSYDKEGTWLYADWDNTSWDLQPIAPMDDISKYS